MAFELLVELDTDNVNWTFLNNGLKNQAQGLIEFFPIPKFESSKKNYLGISVVNSDISSEKIEAFKNIINFLLDSGHSIYELYSSSEFTKENINALSKKFFG